MVTTGGILVDSKKVRALEICLIERTLENRKLSSRVGKVGDYARRITVLKV